MASPSYTYTKDPNQYYIEESAYRYHNPPLPTEGIKGGVSRQDLPPIPPPPPFSAAMLPTTGHCEWSWDRESRVLLGKFSQFSMHLIDHDFLFKMMERDDVTVISEGLVTPSKLYDSTSGLLDYFSDVLHDEYYHKIRRYDIVTVNGMCKCSEKDNVLSMKACEYVKYLRQRMLVLGEKSTSEEEKEMSFKDHKGAHHSINVETTVLYLFDLEIGKLLPKMYLDFIESMRMPGVLPGGTHCMMSAVCIKQLLRTKLCARYCTPDTPRTLHHTGSRHCPTIHGSQPICKFSPHTFLFIML